MAGGRDLCREIITLSRLGGVSIQDKYRAKEEAAEASKNKKATKGRAPAKDVQKTMVKSQSLPTLGATKVSFEGTKRMSTRRGGGWARGDAPAVDLTNFKEKLDHAREWNLDVDFCEKPYFRTALWQAAWKNHESIVQLLIDRGASVSAADFQGRTPLHEAAYYGHMNLVELFIDRGHPIDCVDSFGQTPLFRAIEGGRHEVVQYLMQRGAKANKLDKDNVTVQHLAAFRGMSVLSDYLLAKGAYKNRFSIDEASPMAIQRHKSAVKPLLSGGSLVLDSRLSP